MGHNFSFEKTSLRRKQKNVASEISIFYKIFSSIAKSDPVLEEQKFSKTRKKNKTFIIYGKYFIPPKSCKEGWENMELHQILILTAITQLFSLGIRKTKSRKMNSLPSNCVKNIYEWHFNFFFLFAKLCYSTTLHPLCFYSLHRRYESMRKIKKFSSVSVSSYWAKLEIIYGFTYIITFMLWKHD